MTRLPPRDGEWIDRQAAVQFSFEGRPYAGYRGDVATSALWAAGVRMVGRSFKYHRPRGTLSMSETDTAAMLDDGGRTNLRGDVLPIHNGLSLHSVNTKGGVQRDWLRFAQWGAKMMPVGFYYKAFHTPRWLFPWYERMLRRIAGLGRIHSDAPCPPTPKDYAFCELLVVGSGLAGLAGALAAADQGVQVLLVDEQPRPGGSSLWQMAESPSAVQRRKQLLSRAAAHPKITIRCGTQAAGCYADGWFALVDAERLTKLRAQAVLSASGVIEQPAVFQNNDLPGVLLGSAAQRLIHLYAVQPCQRCVVLAGNVEAYAVAIDLHNAGVEVASVVDLRPDGERSPIGAQVEGLRIPIHRGEGIYQAFSLRGGNGVRAVDVCRLDEHGQPDAKALNRIACDGVVVSVGWSPAAAILYQAGGRFAYSDDVGQLVPQTLPLGHFAAGRVNGVFDWEARVADGERAGLEAASYLGYGKQSNPTPSLREGFPHSHPYPILKHPGKKNFVDLDEDLHLADFVNAHQEGYDNIELLKRYTTVGMGPSQGKLANMNSVRILARLNNRSIDQTGSTTSRPFYHPVPLGHLAGRRFHPERRTPMHGWHTARGAAMIHAGDWLRPEYYPRNDVTREEAILAEARAVREQAALIDLGTLGKIEVTGPDAAEFLERIYTGRFSRQGVGTVRYGLACDESGVIIDDGVVARLDEDRFYVSATTGGAAAFFRELQRWAIVWRMKVVLANLTGQLTAMNLAGPLARTILEKVTDVDLSTENFPFGRAREGSVAGVRATILRIGFVGEMSYEIHLPASLGRHVWETLFDVGSAAGIQPFGLEAQRLLRLEKGHFIVTHDTDALTNPYEAGASWALAMNKPFFVGQRSLEILGRRPPTRKLVGVEFPNVDEAQLPEECHLIVQGDAIVGRITSVAKRSTLGKAIGLAFVQPELAEPGTRLTTRTGRGLAATQVCTLPFYDPQNVRQQ